MTKPARSTSRGCSNFLDDIMDYAADVLEIPGVFATGDPKLADGL